MQQRACVSVMLLFAPILSGQSAHAVVLERVLFVGDSLTANSGVKADMQYPTLIARSLGTILPQNAGVPGATMVTIPGMGGWAANRTAVQALSGYFGFYAVVILLGTNDWFRSFPVADFETAYRQFLTAVPAGVPVLCITPTWRSDDGRNKAGNTLDDFRTAVRRACTGKGKVVVDGLGAIPHAKRYFQDGLHPNEAGNQYLARAVGFALKRVLESQEKGSR